MFVNSKANSKPKSNWFQHEQKETLVSSILTYYDHM